MSSSAPPSVPPPGAHPSSERSPLERVDWAGVVRTDWLGPLKVAAAILGVAAVLAVLIGLGLRPALPGLHWTLRTTLVFFAWLWAGAFGADLTGHATAGGMQSSLGGGTFPLTITIVALGAGAWLFRRCTAGVSRASSVVWFAVRAAVLTAIPPLVVSWVLYAGRGDLVGFGSILGDFDRLGVSSTGAFFSTLLVTLLTLLATATTRRGLLSGRAERVRSLLVGPVVGAAVLLVALIPLGLLAALMIWVFRGGGFGGGTHLTGHEWLNLAAAAIAFAPTLALWQLALGAAGRIHAVAGLSLGPSASSDTGIRHWAASTGINHGVWFAVVLAPILLAVTAYAVVRLARRDGVAEQRRRLGAWVGSLLVAIPALFHIASLHGHGSYDQINSSAVADKYGIAGTVPNSMTAHAGAGPDIRAIVLVVLYAAVIALLVALATRIVTRASIARLLAPRGSATLTDETIMAGTTVAASSGAYQAGEVVNGWRWDGDQWVPAPQD